MKLKGLVVLVGLAPLLFASSAKALDTQNFSINSFEADYYLDRNPEHLSTLQVFESIDAQFPDYNQNHGILRALPETLDGNPLGLTIDSVTADPPANYTTYTDSGNLVLKIGDPSVYVHGPVFYTIDYHQKDVARLSQDNNSFIWNTNGTQWNQPFKLIDTRLYIPKALVGQVSAKPACYVGSYGDNSSGRCTLTSQDLPDGTRVLEFKAQNLAPGETLTMAEWFKPGTFAFDPAIASARHAEHIHRIWSALAATLIPLLAFIYLFSRWWRYGRDPKGPGVIIPEYTPPDNLDVLASSYLLKEKFIPSTVSAVIIELAVGGYIQIIEQTKNLRLRKDKTEYSLKIVKDVSGLPIATRKALWVVFPEGSSSGSEVDLNKLVALRAKGQIPFVRKQLGVDLKEQGYLRNNPEKVAKMDYAIGIVGLIIGFFSIQLSNNTPSVAWVSVSIILTSCLAMVFARYMPSRTAKGVEVRNHLLGLKMYIKMAEAERIKFLQSPTGAEKVRVSGIDPSSPAYQVKLFEKLLPYAMLFGLEKEWTKEFADIYKTPPTWYSGNWASFNSGYFFGSLNNFAGSMPSFVSPTSGGGGFAGGGGGGGGGGGW